MYTHTFAYIPLDERVSFDLIRYANCWEDTDVLVEALDIRPGDRCLSIASAGDNALALLAFDPAKVVAFDLSHAQLACLELRKAAYAELSHEDLLSFLGYSYSPWDRIEIYRELRESLSARTLSYWDRHPSWIKDGIIHQGKFERYLKFFGQRLIRLIHNPYRIKGLLEEKSVEDRRTFYDSTWNTRRWRWFFKIFFSRLVLGYAGRDPEFARYVDGSISDRILERSKYGLTELPTHNNPYLTYILTGGFGEHLPFYVRKENYPRIKQNLDKLEVYQGSTDAVLNAYLHSFDAFNLSDIFEYMDVSSFQRVARTLIDAAKPGARMAYWNMLVPRHIAPCFPNEVASMDRLSEELFKKDKAFFYQSFHLDVVT